MKKLKPILFLLTLLAIQINGHTQDLVKDGAQWNIANYSFWSPGKVSYSLRIEGDTIIDNILYKKMFVSYDSLNTEWVEIREYIREDSLKKVYLKTPVIDERIIYDFNLIEGDTLIDYGTCGVVVTDIDSIAIESGELRKRMKIEGVGGLPYATDDYWIEGIGSKFGLIHHMERHCVTDAYSDLLCHYIDDELIYRLDPTTCFITTSVNQLEINGSIKIFPNPAGDAVQIELSDSNAKIKSIKLYSIIGSLFEFADVDENYYKINISPLPKGVYHILIELDTGGLLSKKIIKI